GVIGSYTETIYLQSAEVKSPLTHTPIMISDSSGKRVTFSPRIFINSSKKMGTYSGNHTDVNMNGVFQVDTLKKSDGSVYYKESASANVFRYKGDNMNWITPDYNFGLDVDLKLTDVTSLSLGINNSSISNTNLTGYRIGLGFTQAKNGLAIRFDLGALWQESAYDASSVVKQTYDDIFSDPVTDIYFMRDIKTEAYFNYYFGLTINSYNPEWPFGFFLNLGFIKQKLIDFEPENLDPTFYFFSPVTYVRTDTRQDFAYSIYSISPGIYFNISDLSRIIFTMR